MTVDAWQPLNHPTEITQEQLSKLLQTAQQFTEDLNLTLDWQWIQPFASVSAKIWTPLLENLQINEIENLIRLFTLAEQKQHWGLGEKSAVIPLFKFLRAKQGINRELVQWVKANSENKYLPFGPLL